MHTYYELLTLLSGNLSEEETQHASDAVRQFVEKHQAKILKHAVWDRRKLAYPINRARQGIYLVTELEMDPSQVNALDRALQLEKSVLRHQLVKAYHKTTRELAQEARQRESSFARPPVRTPVAQEPAAPALSREELEEKLEEILTDDMVK